MVKKTEYARPEVMDRNPLSHDEFQAYTPAFPSAYHIGSTFTMPANKKGILNQCGIVVLRNAVPGVSGLMVADILHNNTPILRASTITATVGQGDRKMLGYAIYLQPGDLVQTAYGDASTGGSWILSIFFQITLFDP